MTSEKTENVDGHQCEVVTFTYSRDPSVQSRFWIDMERGRNVLKREGIHNSFVSLRVSNVILERFSGKQGVTVWLPISGTFEHFGTVSSNGKPNGYGSKATNLEKYSVLRESIRLNTRPGNDRFAVRFRDGTLVTDQLKQSQYVFGKNLPVKAKPLTRDETDAMLQEQIRQARMQGNELTASSWERSGVDWTTWTLVATGLILLTITSIVLLRRRHG